MISVVESHVDDGAAKLSELYATKANFVAWLKALLRPLEAVEAAVQVLTRIYDIESRAGIQLDHIGEIVGQRREGRTDEVYRVWLIARVAVNRSHGLPEDFYRIGHLVLDALDDDPGGELPADLRFFDSEGPPGCRLTNYGPQTSDPWQVARILRELKGAGVPFLYAYAPRNLDPDAPELFSFSASGSTEAASDEGFGAGRLMGSSNGLTAPYDPLDETGALAERYAGGSLEQADVAGGQLQAGFRRSSLVVDGGVVVEQYAAKDHLTALDNSALGTMATTHAGVADVLNASQLVTAGVIECDDSDATFLQSIESSGDGVAIAADGGDLLLVVNGTPHAGPALPAPTRVNAFILTHDWATGVSTWWLNGVESAYAGGPTTNPGVHTGCNLLGRWFDVAFFRRALTDAEAWRVICHLFRTYNEIGA